MGRKDDTLIVKNAKVQYVNLNGREEKYNPAGRRYIAVVIEDAEQAERLRSKKWKIRHTQDDQYILYVRFMEGSWPQLKKIEDVEGKTLVIYAYKYRVETNRRLLKGVIPLLAGVKDDKQHTTNVPMETTEGEN